MLNRILNWFTKLRTPSSVAGPAPEEPPSLSRRVLASRSLSFMRDRARNLLHGRSGAERAVADALLRLRERPPSEAQLDELSDALDALSDMTYGDAVRFAESALRPRGRPAPDAVARLDEMQHRYVELRTRPFPREE